MYKKLNLKDSRFSKAVVKTDYLKSEIRSNFFNQLLCGSLQRNVAEFKSS
jgi:hypothetical protein